MSKEKLRVLIIEDSEDDLALLLRELNNGKFVIEYELVDDAQKLENSLKNNWDIIISDYSLPAFNGFEALILCNKKGIKTPFIMVSGTVGEDIAVEMMKAGAKDYIMKKSLKRLLPAVERELADSKIRERNILIAEQKEVIFEINLDILNAESLEELLQRIHSNIKKVLHAENCFVAIYDSVSDEISFPYFMDKYDTPLQSRKKGKGFTEYLFKKGIPLIVGSADFKKIVKENKLETNVSLHESWLSVPLIVHSNPIGIIVISSYEKNILYNEEDKNFLSGISNQIALAIEKRKSEEALREDENKFRHISSTTSDISYSCVKNKNGTAEISWMMGAVENILGYTVNYLLEIKCWGNLVIKEDYEIFKENVLNLSPGKSAACEVRLKHKNGNIVWIQSLAECVQNASFKNNFVIYGGMVDITERKWAEDNLRKSEEHYRTLLNAIPDLMFRLDGKGRIIDYHAEDVSNLYIYPEKFLGKYYKDVLPQQVSEKFSIAIKGAKESGEINKFEYELVMVDEKTKIYESRVTCYGDECVAIIRDITESRNSERALIESENKYRNIFENVQDVFYRTDNKGIILDISPSIERYSGFKREEVIGNNAEMFYFSSNDRDIFLNKVTKSGQVSDYEIILKSNTGKPIHTSVNAHLYFDVKGIPLGIEGSLRDITERKRIEETLKEREEQYRKLYELSPETIYVQTEGKIVFINPAGLKLFKAKDENEIIGKEVLDFIHPDYKKIVLGRMSDVKNNVVDVPLKEEKYLRLDGSAVDVEVSASPFVFKGKSGALVLLREITERKKAEEALKESEEKYRLLIETMHDGVMQVGIDDRINFVNNSMCEILGYTYHELIGKIGVDTIIYEKDREIVREKNRIRLTGASDIYEVRGVKKSGEIIWLSINGTPIGDKKGNVIGSVGFLSDITERKRAEEELIKISQAINQSPVIIIITDVNGDIEYVNPKFVEVTGYRPEEVIGQNSKILKSGEKSREEYKELWDTIIAGKDWAGEFHNRKKNGELYWENASISPVRDSVGKITHFLAVKEDITDKKRREIELINAKEKAVESERLKTSFLANMSHELRTPMVGILGFAELMKDLTENDELKDFADNILRSGKRLLETLNLILDLSRIEAGKLEIKASEVNVVKLSKEVYENYTAEAKKKNLRINFKSSKERIVSKVDERMLWESINNLINNAIKYTKEGEVNIEVETKKIGKEKKAIIKVSDTGMGIPEESLSVIFEEFRQVSEGYSRGFEGTGLGLTITKRFVEKTGGNILVESEPGVGSVFTIVLPLLESEVEETEPELVIEEKPLTVSRNREINILCVDDDSFTREFLEHILKASYTLTFAETGTSAIEKAKAKKFDIILMDINLGKGMDGIETARKIHKLAWYEKVPVIAMTAFAMKGDKEEFLNSGMNDYISKPFKSTELIMIIEKVLKN